MQTQLQTKGLCKNNRRNVPMTSKQSNHSRANGRNQSGAGTRGQLPASNNATNKRKPLDMFRKGVNRLIHARHMEKQRSKRGLHTPRNGVCLEVVNNRRDSSESRTTQRSCTDSIAGSIHSQHKTDLMKNGLTKIHHSHVVPLDSLEMQMFENGVVRQTIAQENHDNTRSKTAALVHACVSMENDEPDVTTPLVHDKTAVNSVDYHVPDRHAPRVLSPINESESHSNTDS